MRLVALALLLPFAMAGCATSPPLSVPAPSGAEFTPKLINFFSFGDQFLDQTNFNPNTQGNQFNQFLQGNAADGVGGFLGANVLDQLGANTTAQDHTQGQLIL